MAQLHYQYRGKKDFGNLSVRLTDSTDKDYRVSSPLKSKKEFWIKRTTLKNGKTGFKHIQLKDLSVNGDPNYKNHKTHLENIKKSILDSFVVDSNNGKPITKEWLKEAIAKFSNVLDTKEKILKADAEKKEADKIEKDAKDAIYDANLLGNAIKGMFVKYRTNKSELNKYKVTYNRFTEFETYQKRVYKIIDLNQDFANDFINWSLLDMQYKPSYVNAQLKRLRYSAVNAYENDENDIIKVSKKLKSFKMLKDVYKDKEVITLNYDELDIIDNTKVENTLLDAKKAILIGCETGLRYSDQNKLVDTNIKNIDGVNYWQFRTDKTNAIVQITITNRIIDLIKRYGLPQTDYPSNGVKLNRDIKKVCKASQLNELTKGSLATVIKIKGQNHTRNIVGLHPKHDLIVTRSFRRSFATNYYGKIDTALILAVTGHTTEKQLRAYINEKDESNIIRSKQQIDEFHHERKEKKNNIKLTVIPKAI